MLLASLPHARAPAAPAEAPRPPVSATIMTNINADALHNACVAGDAAAVSRLLPAGGTPRNLGGKRFQTPTDKNTPLIVAAGRGHTEIVRMLLQRAGNTIVDHVSAIGFTAAIMAAQYHHADIVRVLADHGANVNLATRRGSAALCLALAPVPSSALPRDPDCNGTRQVNTVKALLQLGAGTLPPCAPLPPPDPTPRNS